MGVPAVVVITQQGRLTIIRASNIIIIGLDNGLSPAKQKAIIWTNDA